MKEQKKRYKTKVSEIWVDDENIMHVEFAKGVELTLEDMEEGYAIFRELGVGPGMRKSRQLLSGGPFTINREAREFAGKSGKDYFVAAAMISDSIVMRFVIHIFNTLQKHDVPFRMFSNEEEALEWLRSFKTN